MRDALILHQRTPLPPPPDGWFEDDYAILWDGRLALIRRDRDLHAAYLQWRDQMQGRGMAVPQLKGGVGRVRLSIFDGAIETDVIELRASDEPAKVGRLPDGRWLIAATRATGGERNARLYAADGQKVGTFSIGDGLAHLRCAADGTIWAGYFDEGIFGGRDKDGGLPVSSAGLARFSPDGRVLWRFHEQAPRELAIDDCHALTLDGEAIWCCPYSDFPLIRFDGVSLRSWCNEINGATTLAINGDHVLLAGGYGDQAERVVLLRLEGDRALPLGEWQCPFPDRRAAALLQGQGGILHFVAQGHWSQVSLARMCASLRG